MKQYAKNLKEKSLFQNIPTILYFSIICIFQPPKMVIYQTFVCSARSFSCIGMYMYMRECLVWLESCLESSGAALQCWAELILHISHSFWPLVVCLPKSSYCLHIEYYVEELQKLDWGTGNFKLQICHTFHSIKIPVIKGEYFAFLN